jgi:2-succinyl-6-hydroxy-2,4-cyclohexadiene-1-carboxylate synthase
MGGSAGDWAWVQKEFRGEALSFPAAPNFAALVSALSAQLARETEPYGIVGYSLGGRVAIAITHALLDAPNPPRKLALLGAGFGFPTEEERSIRKDSDLAWAELIRRNPAEFWRRWYEQPLFSGFDALPEATRQEWLASRLASSAEALARQWEAWGPSQHPFLRPALDAITQSGMDCLYLAGERDTKYRSLSEELTKEGMRTLIIPGAGHLLPLEAPHAVAEALNRFFEG